jgi:hypothetical protein
VYWQDIVNTDEPSGFVAQLDDCQLFKKDSVAPSLFTIRSACSYVTVTCPSVSALFVAVFFISDVGLLGEDMKCEATRRGRMENGEDRMKDVAV